MEWERRLVTDRERQANGQTECFNIVYIKHLCSIFITLGLLIEKRYLPVCQLIDRRVCALRVFLYVCTGIHMYAYKNIDGIRQYLKI